MRSTVRRLWPLALCLAALPACSATRGTPFTWSDLEKFELGVTRRGEVSTQIGDPTTVGFAIKNQYQYVVYRYEYTEADRDGVRNRLLRAGFGPDDKLAFYQFQSNFDVDETDFDISKVTRFTPGTSHRDQVLAEMGEPSGRDVAFVGPQKYEVWIYGIARLEKIDAPVLKKATFYFDLEGTLAWYESQGEGFLLP